jgi:uncharacterized protein YdaU (DUF1376 family)
MRRAAMQRKWRGLVLMAKAPTLAMLPWFPRDYLAATRGLTLAERGAYTDLLWFAWDMGALPNDPKRLARMLGVESVEFDAVWPAIMAKFVLTETGIVNERLERERQHSQKLRTKASEKAAQAAKARWSNAPGIAPSDNAASQDAPSNAPGNAPSINATQNAPEYMLQAMLEHCPPSPSPSASPSRAPAPTPSLGGGVGEPIKVGPKRIGNGRREQTREDKIRLAAIGIQRGLDAETIFKQYGVTVDDVTRESLSEEKP